MKSINFRSTFSFLLLLFFTTGCVSLDTTTLSTAPSNLSPVSSNQVNVYKSDKSIACNYSEVAIISAQGSESFSSNDKLIRKAKSKAGEMGANGIIVSEFGESQNMLGSEPTAEVIAIFEERPCS